MKVKPRDLARIYFCTGARNEALLDVFHSDLVFETDERIASFKALGSAKYSQSPVGVCTTSGSALAECLPAMLESQYSETPLVIITGDRPKKQHGTGAPQTIHHEELTHGVCGSFFEVSLDEFLDLEIERPNYPVHINVLIDDTTNHDQQVKKTQDLDAFEDFLSHHKRPLFLISHENQSLRPFIERFSQRGLPFYAEVMSGAHDLSPIRNDFDLVSLYQKGEFDSVVRVGHTPLSKVWRLLESSPLPVMSFDSRDLPALSYGTLFPWGSEKILANERWWKIVSSVHYELDLPPSEERLLGLYKKFPNAELSLFHAIQESLAEDSIIYLGNSLIIRNFEMTQKKSFKIFGNRGVNGIDGQLSTAIGMAQTTKEHVFCILGDLTTRYDLSAMRDIPGNLHLIIINNQGGRIFETLKLDERIILSHQENFKKIASAFDLSYSNSIEGIHTSRVTELFADLESGRKLLSELRS